MDDDLIEAVAGAIPPFNMDMLKDHVEREISSCVDFVDATYRDCIRMFGGVVTYHGYRVLTPIERAKFELNPNNRIGASITNSELVLVEFKFRWNNEEITPHLYMPYVKNGMITIDDKRYAVQKTITEQVFARTGDTITVRVIYAPLRFERKLQYIAEPVTDGPKIREYLYMAKLHLKHRDSARTTIPHYIIAKYGYAAGMRMLGQPVDDIQFVDDILNDTDEWVYYAARRVKKNVPAGCYLKIRRDQLSNREVCRVAVNLLYALTRFHQHTAQTLYEPTGMMWRLMLGWLIKNERAYQTAGQCLQQMDDHLTSLDRFFDSITRQRCISFGVNVDDIYELLRYVYVNMDSIMVQSVQQNLYDKRVNILDNLAIQLFVQIINRRFYAHEKNAHRFVKDDLTTMLRIPPRRIAQLYTSACIISSPEIYGDSWLPAVGIRKTRFNGNQGGKRLPSPASPENKFHASSAVVETLVAFTGKIPGRSGAINPHLQITANGGVIRPDYAAEIERINPYL